MAMVGVLNRSWVSISRLGRVRSVAIVEATRNRVRPIFMSTLTSLFGLVPLVIFPGAGAELYRGLGVVVFGGLGLSTLATLIIVPPLLALALRSPLARGVGARPSLNLDLPGQMR